MCFLSLDTFSVFLPMAFRIKSSVCLCVCVTVCMHALHVCWCVHGCVPGCRCWRLVLGIVLHVLPPESLRMGPSITLRVL